MPSTRITRRQSGQNLVCRLHAINFLELVMSLLRPKGRSVALRGSLRNAAQDAIGILAHELCPKEALGLTSAELNVYLNIFMHWYDAGRLPFPATSTIAKRMGATQRHVQRLIDSLAKKGMLEKVPGERRGDPKQYDVRPLLLKLQHRAKQWAAHKERPFLEIEDVL